MQRHLRIFPLHTTSDFLVAKDKSNNTKATEKSESKSKCCENLERKVEVE